jgi:Ni,Fe-hydrogenase III component G
MINQIEITLENLLQEIESFYDYKSHHLVCINATDTGDNIVKLQWIFSTYEKKNEWTIFTCNVSYGTCIPSITKIIPAAIMSEMEIVDLFGLDVENTKKGLYLDERSPDAPLRCKI